MVFLSNVRSIACGLGMRAVVGVQGFRQTASALAAGQMARAPIALAIAGISAIAIA